jgi:phosphoribosyl-ATP pyrophosphohydrolase/phosphoribosyl-AMP cyclohydrolase
MKPDFEKYIDGLVPVIVQDNSTGVVLMMGYMNEEAYTSTLAQKKVVFYSRSKKQLWLKGNTSGNFLQVVDVLTDCDQDCLLIKADPAGPVCHTGNATCFNEANTKTGFLNTLENIIEERKQETTQDSYVAALIKKGINKIAQKLGEEAIELIIEAKDNNDELFKNEAADLLFHYLVLLNVKGYRLKDIEAVLE